MKNVNYVINGVLAAAVLILFVLHFTGKKSPVSLPASVTVSGEAIAGFPVAYFNVDSLLLNYNFSKDLNEQLTRKQENARANLTQQARNLQSDVDNFEFKMRNGAFATQDRADQERQRIIKKQQELNAMDEKLSRDLMEESQRLNAQLSDTIRLHLQDYNREKKYQIIFSSTAGSPVFHAEEVYNITSDLIEYLNKRWSGGSGN